MKNRELYTFLLGVIVGTVFSTLVFQYVIYPRVLNGFRDAAIKAKVAEYGFDDNGVQKFRFLTEKEDDL